MIGSAKDDVHLLERDAHGLGDEEVHKDGEHDVDSHEEEETLEALLGEEGGEELLEDGVGDVLALRCHADGLGSNVDGEDFAGPHPDTGAPRWLVEETREDCISPGGLSDSNRTEALT